MYKASCFEHACAAFADSFVTMFRVHACMTAGLTRGKSHLEKLAGKDRKTRQFSSL